MEGVVYVLTNQAMPGLVKIGKTSASVEDRMKSLDSTGVPLPFECFSAWEVNDADGAERALHEAFGDHRIRDKREFFRISPDKPTAILKHFGTRNVTPSDDVVSDDDPTDDLKALERARSRKPNFKFEMVGISVGETLHSVFDDAVTCTVAKDNKVEFQGKELSLSKAAVLVAHENGKKWNHIAGPAYWKYDDKTLSELREESDNDE